jgi:hypothetical protein
MKTKKTQSRRKVARGHQQRRAHVVHQFTSEKNQKNRSSRRIQLERDRGHG